MAHSSEKKPKKPPHFILKTAEGIAH